MILFRLNFSFILLLTTIHCSLFSERDVFGKDSSIHLVLNATGYATEFCLYQVESSSGECKTKPLKTYPRCVEYFPENNNSFDSEPKTNLDQVYKGLADLEFSRPELKQKIQNVGYMATGSLGSSKESTKTIKEVDTYFKSEGLKVTAKNISGEEEVKFALAAVLQDEKTDKSKDISVLQINSDSVNLITSEKGKAAKPISVKIGIYSLLEEISNIKPDINACRQPISAFFKTKESSFEKCKNFVLENLNKSQRLNNLKKSALSPTQEIYTTGSTWNYYYPNKQELSLEELNKTGTEFCSLTIDEILKKGIKKKFVYNLCYSLSYKAALAESLGINKLKILKKEPYLQSIASSPTLFPGICK